MEETRQTQQRRRPVPELVKGTGDHSSFSPFLGSGKEHTRRGKEQSLESQELASKVLVVDIPSPVVREAQETCSS